MRGRNEDKEEYEEDKGEEENEGEYEDLHLGLLPGVDGHHVAVDDSHGAAGGRRDEVGVDLAVRRVIMVIRMVNH